jgi:hypothetical protein
MPANSWWSSISYGNGLFVAVAAVNSVNAASSTDGITWNLRTMPAVRSWFGTSYGNGVFCALGYNTTSAAYSTNGTTWTLTTMPANRAWATSAYGNGVFTASGYNTTSAVYSTDGITWTLTTMPANINWYKICFSNNIFVAVGGGLSSTTTTSAATSINGITWTLRTMPALGAWRNLSSQPSYSIDLQQLIGQPQKPISSNIYTIQNNDKLLVFKTTAACTVTLPNPQSFLNREITLKQIAAFAVNSASSNVQPLTSETAGTEILSGAGKFARLVSNGKFWIVMEAN